MFARRDLLHKIARNPSPTSPQPHTPIAATRPICFVGGCKRAAGKDWLVRASQQVWRQVCAIWRLCHASPVQRYEHHRLAQLDTRKGQLV